MRGKTPPHGMYKPGTNSLMRSVFAMGNRKIHIILLPSRIVHMCLSTLAFAADIYPSLGMTFGAAYMSQRNF